jgi:hypothetical protein
MIEVVIASALAIVIIFAALSMLDSGTKVERAGELRHDALVAARGALGQLSRDLRQAFAIAPQSTADSLDMDTYLDGSPRRVVYSLASGELRRALYPSYPLDGSATPPPAPPPVTLVDGISGSALFCYSYEPPTAASPGVCLASTPPAQLSSIRITLIVQPHSSSAGPITLATDVEPRNL